MTTKAFIFHFGGTRVGSVAIHAETWQKASCAFDENEPIGGAKAANAA